MPEYISENQALIVKTKDELLKILNAFLKSGIDLDIEVYPALQYKDCWFNNDNITVKQD